MGDSVVIQLPVAFLSDVIRDGGVDAIQRLGAEWSVIYSGDGGIITEAFEDQAQCADRVAEIYKSVLYVLKSGVPRKNVRIEVKARFR